MIRIVIFTVVGVVFGAAVGCVAGLGLCYVLREVFEVDMPMGRIAPISSVAAAAGAILIGAFELRRELAAPIKKDEPEPDNTKAA